MEEKLACLEEEAAYLRQMLQQKGKGRDTGTGKYPRDELCVVPFTLTCISDPTMGKRNTPPETPIAPLPKRIRHDGSHLVFNGEPHFFRSASMPFGQLLQRPGQVYFDRTRYISKLEELDNSILFCRPRRFGKSLTISMLEHFHGLQYADEHQTFYQVCDYILDFLDMRN